ncbi:UvrD-helicase domain-containing protein [Methylobacillus arboreus]|uniref:UvrD-helicase domain-containing protein n=1 Tax=Methylobacillus arboreus TaxID=755170 RepID=UPI001E4C1B79|nr:UvrD-helicase domain-containing protein [Methylobacillus arboreus]MCB5189530.1 UvrD-helicase domain-containing protein [Methylobacillus arboreus]
MSGTVGLESMDLLQIDSLSRERALELASFIVEAPAGAGKTELLTQRFLRLLTTVQEPEEIVAITFTNKAAAEMRARILDSLLMAAGGQVPEAAHKRLTFKLGVAALQHAAGLGWQLLDNPSRLRIFTIDSLSGHLSRQMPLLSRFGSQPAISEDAETHYRLAAERTLALMDDEALGEPVRLALSYVDNDVQKLIGLLIDMLGKRDQWMEYASRDDAPQMAQRALEHLLSQDIQAAASLLEPRLQHALMPVARYAASNLPCDVPQALLLDWETPLPATLQALPAWLAVCDLLLTGTGSLRKTVNVRNGLPATPEAKPFKEQFAEITTVLAQVPDMEAALHRLRSLPRRQDAQGWQMVAALAQLLKLAVAQLWLVFQQAGEVDFVEVSQRALQALGGEDETASDLAMKLDYQISHLLVDEFQDTSPGQVRLLQRLTQGWLPGDGRTLFAVGDPMQSIYRFRKANVGLFLEVAEEGIGELKLERLQLCRNNRSCPPVVDWINTTFRQVFPPQDSVVQGAIHYREFVATQQGEAGAGVFVHPLIAGAGEDAGALRIREAARAVEIIRSTWASNPEASIAVLVRARTHLETLVAEIRRHHADLHFQAVEIEPLAGRQSVQDLLALTHALLQRADRVNWLAILRAPWCGLSLADMHVLAGHERYRTIWSLLCDREVLEAMSEDGRKRSRHVVQVLSEALGQQGRMPLGRWLESAWLMLGGAQCLWQASDITDVEAYFRLVEQLDQQGRFSLERLVQEVGKLYAAPDIEANGQLQFMTIHKSKGLEFDTVILPGLERRARNGDTPLLLWEEVAVETEAGVSTELVTAPFIPKGATGRDEPSPYSYLKLLEKARADNENARVLYVAATRTERSLHLLGSISPNNKGELRPENGTFLDLLWPHVVAQFMQAAEQVPLEVTARPEMALADFIPKLVRVEEPGMPRVFAENRHDQASTGQPHEEGPVLGRQASLEAHIGTLAHKYVEIMAATSDLDGWLARLPALKPAMVRWLRQQGHYGESAEEGAAQVLKLLELTLQSPDGRWVLTSRDEASAELAMGHVGENGLKQLVVDRCFIENGERWIIDYKSTRFPADADTGTLLKAAEAFEPQLTGYASLFAGEGLPVRKAIYFMALGKLCELP